MREQFIHPKLRFRLLPWTRCSCNKNIDVLAAYHCENDSLYGHHLGRRWWCFSPWNDCPNAVRTGPQTAQTKHWAEHTRRRSCPAQVTKKSIHSLVGHSVQRRKVLPPPPKLSCNKNISARTNQQTAIYKKCVDDFYVNALSVNHRDFIAPYFSVLTCQRRPPSSTKLIPNHRRNQ